MVISTMGQQLGMHAVMVLAFKKGHNTNLS